MAARCDSLVGGIGRVFKMESAMSWVGILRLRRCFALRSIGYAQDDRSRGRIRVTGQDDRYRRPRSFHLSEVIHLQIKNLQLMT